MSTNSSSIRILCRFMLIALLLSVTFYDLTSAASKKFIKGFLLGAYMAKHHEPMVVVTKKHGWWNHHQHFTGAITSLQSSRSTLYSHHSTSLSMSLSLLNWKTQTLDTKQISSKTPDSMVSSREATQHQQMLYTTHFDLGQSFVQNTIIYCMGIIYQ